MAIAAEVGIDGVTVSEVIARSGVARATLYRRWPTRDALITAMVNEIRGRPPYPLTGNLEADIRQGTEQGRGVFAQPGFRAFLPALVRDLLRHDAADGVSDTFDRIAPNVRRIAEAYAQGAAQAGMRTDIDPYVVTDIVIGAMLARLFSTGRAPTKEAADQIADVLINGVRRR
jgi:AcrR family transcriptional regulator